MMGMMGGRAGGTRRSTTRPGADSRADMYGMGGFGGMGPSMGPYGRYRPEGEQAGPEGAFAGPPVEQYLFRIEVPDLPDGARPQAEPFLAALVDRLDQVLRSEFDRYTERMQVRLAAVQEEIERLRMERGPEADPAAPDDGEPDLSSLRQKRRSTAEQISKLEMESARYEARRQALLEQIQRALKDIEARTQQDAVIGELKEILTIAEQRVAAAEQMHGRGVEPITSVTDAREKLARARIELAQRKEMIAADAGKASLDKYSGQLADMEIRSVEIKAELQAVQGMLDKLDAQIAQCIYIEKQRARTDPIRRRLGALQAEQEQLATRRRHLTAPEARLVGATD